MSMIENCERARLDVEMRAVQRQPPAFFLVPHEGEGPKVFDRLLDAFLSSASADSLRRALMRSKYR